MRLSSLTDTYNDFVRKWHSCFVKHDDFPDTPMVLDGNRESPGILSLTTQLYGTFELPYTIEHVSKLDLLVPIPGYRQVGNKALLLLRTADRQWTRGLSSRNYMTHCPIRAVWNRRAGRWSAGSDDSFYEVCRAFLGDYKYPVDNGTCHRELERLVDGVDKNLSIPLGRFWAASLNPFADRVNLYLGLQHVADLNVRENVWELDQARALVHQEVSDFIRRNLGYVEAK